MVNWPRRVIQIMVYLEVYLVKMVIFHGEVWKKTRPGFSTQVIHNHHGSVKNGTWRPGLRPSQKGYTLCIDIVYTIITMIKIVIIIVIVIINNNNNNNNNNNKYIYIYILHIYVYYTYYMLCEESSRNGRTFQGWWSTINRQIDFNTDKWWFKYTTKDRYFQMPLVGVQ
jgi:hypothetical protein